MLDRVPQVVIVDAIGSTEGGMGHPATMKGLPVHTGRFSQSPPRRCSPRTAARSCPAPARSAWSPPAARSRIGYYKDAEKSARTFRVINGVRYSFPGDMATVEADGSITLLGRGSQMINTGGEKVFPEEVEEAIKRAPRRRRTAWCSGLPDERFGERVAAVVALADGADISEDDVIAGCRAQLAAFKAPRSVTFVAHVSRAANGKADYRTAKAMAGGPPTP